MKKSKNLFWKVYAIVLLVVCAICAFALFIGNFAMMDYEKSQRAVPNIAADYAKRITDGDYSCIVDSEVKPATLIFEENTFINAVKEKVTAAGGCTSKKGFSTDRYEKPVYLLMAGDEKIAELEFVKEKKKTFFGFATFSLNSIKPAISGNYEITMLVPEGGEVFINGIKVPETYKTGEKLEQGTLPNLFENTSKLETLEYYKISGLMKEVDMKYSYKGSDKKLDLKYSKSSDAWIVKNQNAEITIVAPSNISVYVNDKLISNEERFVHEKGMAIDEIKTSSKYVACDVTLTTYTIAGINGEYTVTGKSANGTKMTPSFDEETLTYTFPNGFWPEDLAKYGVNEEDLIKRAEEYAKFVNNDGNRDTGVLPYVYEKSQAYEDFKDFWATLSKHEEFWFENEKLETVEFYNDNLFKATVTFDYWIKGFNHQTDNTKSYATKVTFWYGKINGSWKIVDYSLS